MGQDDPAAPLSVLLMALPSCSQQPAAGGPPAAPQGRGGGGGGGTKLDSGGCLELRLRCHWAAAAASESCD